MSRAALDVPGRATPIQHEHRAFIVPLACQNGWFAGWCRTVSVHTFGGLRLVITRIREVRRARGLTLDDVARRCIPSTTPQTIGRLETGTRTVSVGWLNRIAGALGVEAQDLVEGRETAGLKVIAVLGQASIMAPRRPIIVIPPRVEDGQIAVLVGSSIGEYRAGDELWCDTLEPAQFKSALNRDVLVPRPAGRFLFGRLINRDEEKLQILPLDAGGRQQVVANPQWLAVASRLLRKL